MKQRIITGVIAAALFIPIVIYGGLPFVLLTYLLATVGLYELLKMKKISIFSVHGLLTRFISLGYSFSRAVSVI